MSDFRKASQKPPFSAKVIVWILVTIAVSFFSILAYEPTKDFLARIPTISRVREVVEAKGFTDVVVSEPDRAKAHKYCPESNLYYDVWARSEAKGIDLYVCTDGEQYMVSSP